MPTVCAVVLTRDRYALFEDCLRSLLAQTRRVDRIVVVDNASTDGTPERVREAGLLDGGRVEYHRLPENLGGSGGFAAGVERALGGASDWLWLMDDDAEPRPDALERLLASPPAADPGVAVLASTVRGADGEIELLHRGHLRRFLSSLPAAAYEAGHADLGFASFVGFMIRTPVARAIGLPRAEFFLGCDDVEYSLRARRHGALRLVPESEIVHKLGMGGGTPTRRSRFWNRVLGGAWTSASWASYWKQLYALRNFVWLRRHHGRVPPAALGGITAAYVARSLMYDDRPLRRIPWLVRFALRGWRGDFAPSPTPAEWAAIARGS